MERRFFSCAEIAEYLGLSEKTVRRKVDRREMPAVRIGKNIRIDLKALEAELENVRKA